LLDDRHYDPFLIFENVLRKHPKGPDPRFGQPMVTSCVSCRRVGHTVHCPIDLDRKHRALTVEVEDEWTSRVLAAEFETMRARSKKSP
jgi:hypothetical protein